MRINTFRIVAKVLFGAVMGTLAGCSGGPPPAENAAQAAQGGLTTQPSPLLQSTPGVKAGTSQQNGGAQPMVHPSVMSVPSASMTPATQPAMNALKFSP